LNVCRVPALRPYRPQKCGWVEGARPYFHIQWLQYDAALLGPKLLQAQDKSLKAAYICLVHSDPHFVRCAQIGVRKTAIIQACGQRGDARSQLALCWGGLL